MIEIRSLGAFCNVLATCHPDEVDATLNALGLTREAVILTPPSRNDALEIIYSDLLESKDRESSLRDSLRDAERQRDEAQKTVLGAQEAMARFKRERDEAQVTIRGLCRAFGRDPDEAPVIAALTQTAPESPAVIHTCPAAHADGVR